MDKNEMMKYMDKIGILIVQTLVNKLNTYSSLKDSRLINEIKYEVDLSKKDNYTITIAMPNYSIYVDQGRKPNSIMPPKAPILEWMKRKGIDEQYEYPIRRKIAVRGIEARPFMSMAAKRIQAVSDIMTTQATVDLQYKLDELVQRLEKSK